MHSIVQMFYIFMIKSVNELAYLNSKIQIVDRSSSFDFYVIIYLLNKMNVRHGTNRQVHDLKGICLQKKYYE